MTVKQAHFPRIVNGNQPRFTVAETVALGCAAVLAVAFLFLPWVNLLGEATSGGLLIFDWYFKGYDTNLSALLLLPFAATVGGVGAVWGALDPTARRLTRIVICGAGVISLIGFVIYFVDIAEKDGALKVASGWDGIGFWLALLASVGLVLQLFIPRELPEPTLEDQLRTYGWIFLSPWLFGFLVFTAIPILASLYFSVTSFNLNRPEQTEFIGLDNYRQLFNDPLVDVSLGVTLKFALISLPLSIMLPVGLAALLNAKHLFGKRVFRTLFYMPYMVPGVSAIFIWGGVLNTNTGWINRFLSEIGVRGPDWLNSTSWIYPGLTIIGLWGIGNAFLVTLASMQGVPTELYEAAKVDGAGPLTSFRKITLPMISPVIFYNLVLSVIGLFRYFEVPYILKDGTGDPGNSTYFFNLHLYKQAFTLSNMGYAAALAWLMFVLAMGCTLLLFFSARYWVYYAGGEQS